jgi:ankyrin repeat protein
VRDSNDHSLLHTAAYSGKVEVMQFLLDKGCCLVDDRTTADITPVLWACDGVRLHLFQNYLNFLF